MKPNIYNFFKFLEEKENRPIPLKAKFLHAPETLTPEELDVKGNLNLRNTPITSLPKGLTVGGWLDLINTPITSLPEGLTVGGDLDLENTEITSLPEGLKVKRNLWVENTPLANKTDEEIKAMIGPNGYIKDEIYR